MPHIEIEGALQGDGLRVAIAVARFNSFITDRLLGGALDGLRRHGVADDAITIVRVPGAWELPVTVKALAESGKYDGIISLGAVIRGDTPHFDFVAGEASRGLATASADFDVPIGFGLLTCINGGCKTECATDAFQPKDAGKDSAADAGDAGN